MSGEAAHLLAERRTPTATIDQSLSRFDIFPRIRFPFTKWQFLTNLHQRRVPRDVLDRAADHETGLNLEDPINRDYYDLAVQITGRSSAASSIVPAAATPRSSSTRSSRFPQHRAHLAHRRLQQVTCSSMAPTPSSGRSTRLSYGIANRFFRRRAAAADPRSC
jgi:hypothetical protein